MNESDWSRFGGDPTPGEPLDVQRANGFVKDAQANSRNLLNFVQRNQNHGDQIVWEGLSASVFKEEMSLLLPDIRKVVEAGDSLIAALKNYQFQLESLKAGAEKQAQSAIAAQSEIERVQSQLGWARQEIARIHLEAAKSDLTPGATINVDTSYFEQIIHQASRDLAYQRSQYSRAMREIDFLRGESKSLRKSTALSIEQSSYFKLVDDTPLSRILQGIEHFGSIALSAGTKFASSEVDDLKAGAKQLAGDFEAGAKQLAGAEVKFVDNELGGRDAVESVLHRIETDSEVISLATWVVGGALVLTGVGAPLGAGLIWAGSAIQAGTELAVWQYKSAQYISGQIPPGQFGQDTFNTVIDVAGAGFGLAKFMKLKVWLKDGSILARGASRAGSTRVSQASLKFTEAVSGGAKNPNAIVKEVARNLKVSAKNLNKVVDAKDFKNPEFFLSGINVAKNSYSIGNDLSPVFEHWSNPRGGWNTFTSHPMTTAKHFFNEVVSLTDAATP